MGINRASLVKQSTTTQRESCSCDVQGNLMIISIVILSYFLSGIGNDWTSHPGS